jgi:hypothetical protein
MLSMSKVKKIETPAGVNQRRINHITWRYNEYCNAPPNREKFILQELLDYIGDICNEEGLKV